MNALPEGVCRCVSEYVHRRDLQRIIDNLDVEGARAWTLAHGMPQDLVVDGEIRPFREEALLAALHKMRAVGGTTEALRIDSRIWCGLRGVIPGVSTAEPGTRFGR